MTYFDSPVCEVTETATLASRVRALMVWPSRRVQVRATWSTVLACGTTLMTALISGGYWLLFANIVFNWVEREFKSPITVKNTYAWGNGFNRWGFNPFEGDGNGFKLGGGDEADRAPAAHVITNSISWLNAAGGFVYNRFDRLRSPASTSLTLITVKRET